mgnify:CR=1 FL=1
MARYELPRTEFLPHPDGPDEGVIYEVRDLGDIETAYGVKHKVAVKVQSFGHMMEDGRPFSVQKMMNLSAHDQSDLYKFRCAALGVKTLSDDKAIFFDDEELVGIRVGYVVEHQISQKNGNTYGNIGSIWRLEDQTKGEIVLEAQGNAPQAATSTSGKIDDKDLPF